MSAADTAAPSGSTPLVVRGLTVPPRGQPCGGDYRGVIDDREIDVWLDGEVSGWFATIKLLPGDEWAALTLQAQHGETAEQALEKALDRWDYVMTYLRTRFTAGAQLAREMRRDPCPSTLPFEQYDRADHDMSPSDVW